MDPGNLEASTRGLFSLGPDRVIVILGSEGAVYADADDVVFQPAPTVETVDTTTASDAFVGAYLSSCSRGADPADALDRANQYAAESVRSAGTRKSFPNRS